MTQVEILKYAYIGALESAVAAKRAREEARGNAETMAQREEKALADFEEIRGQLFGEIEKATGAPLN
jgi:hypothetical protein